MCKSVYLRGLLISHGTDSVLTKRAAENKMEPFRLKFAKKAISIQNLMYLKCLKFTC